MQEQRCPIINAVVDDSFRRQLDTFRRERADADCVAAIVDCIRKMRAEGVADNEIAGLFRHAADNLDASTKDGEVEPA
jgi:hypothetical protein